MPGRRNSTSLGGSRLSRQPEPSSRPSVELVDAAAVGETTSARAAPAQSQRSRTESLATRVKQEAFNDYLATPRRSVTALPDTQPLENVGKYIKELVETIHRIEMLGINHVAGDTPKIVVVGDQSAGKSSVINAISGIQVPRSSGTCTRCPMQITLTDKQEPNAQWRCDVSIRREFWYAVDTDPPLDKDMTVPFYPWHPTQTTTSAFKTVYRKDDLLKVIERAQLAILNPQDDEAKYATSDSLPSEKCQTEFSPNLVCLDISAPGLPNLSFYDLPGVIAQAESGNPYLTSMVEALVKKYVATDNATVLLCCAMEGDIQNSRAMGLVYAAEANAKCRTLGILTKPDRLPLGDPLHKWRKVLDGKLFTCGYGFHVMINPSQAEMDKGMDHTTARRHEAAFFKNSTPWNDEFQAFQERFGTGKLRDRLSTILAKQILASLPNIRQRVEQQLTRIDEALLHLPEPPNHDAQRIVYDIITAFTQTVSNHVKGESPDNQFRKGWRALRKTFKEGIVNQHPTLNVATPDVARPQSMAPTRASSVLSTPKSHSKRKPKEEVICIDMSDADKDDASPRKSSPLKRLKTTHHMGRSAPLPRNQYRRVMNLQWLRAELDNHTTSEIPGETDSRAVDHLRKEALTHWDKPLKEFLDGFEALLKTLLHNAINDSFKAWETTELRKKVARLADSLLSEKMFNQRHDIALRTLRLEQLKPMTENEESLEYYRSNALQYIAAKRQSTRLAELMAAESGTDQKDIEKTLGPDPYAREIEAMARVRAYYSVASMRFIDHICQSVQAELLFDRFENLDKGGLRDVLLAVLYAEEDRQERCVGLLAEGTEREQRRRALKAEREKLAEALDALDEQRRKFQEEEGQLAPDGVLCSGNLGSRSRMTVSAGDFESMDGIEEEEVV